MKKFAKSMDNYYLPGCFYINLDNKTLDQDNFRCSSDFFHEYIHYIQDISLPFMNFKFMYFSDTLATLSNQVYEKTIYSKPFPLFVNEIQNTNFELFKFYFDLDDKSYCNYGSNGKLFSDNIQINDLPVNEYRFEFISDEGEEKNIKLSASDLTENMAANIEEHFYGRQELPDFPYRSINKIIEVEYSELKLTNHQITQLIELSLFTLNPVDFMFINLERIRKEKIDINNVTLKEYMFNGVGFKGASSELDCDNIEILQRKSMMNVFSNVKNILGDIAFFNDTKWIQSRVARGFLKRSAEPTFLSDLLLTHEDKKESAKDSLFQTFDIPLVHLSNDHIVSTESPNKETHGELSLITAVIDSVYNNLSGNGNKCVLYGTCCKLEEDEKIETGLVDPCCVVDPFQKDLERIDCPFSIYCVGKKLV